MKILGLKNFFAVATLAIAVSGTSGIRPAGAVPVTFVFEGTCSSCANFGGAGTKVKGTLGLEIAALADGYLIQNTDIQSFTLEFDFNVPNGMTDQTVSFVPNFYLPDLPTAAATPGTPYAPNQTLGGTVGSIIVDSGGDFAIGTIDLWDSEFSTLTMAEKTAITDTWDGPFPFPQLPNNFFSYDSSEPVANSTWSLTGSGQSIPPGDGNGTASFGFKQLVPMPEPGSLLPFMLGSIGLLVVARRRRARVSTVRKA